MWILPVAMLGILVLAGLVVVYVAYPHRGEAVPAAPWLSDVMRRGAEAAPILENTAAPRAEPAGGAVTHASDDFQALDLTRRGSATPEPPVAPGPSR